MKTLLLATFLYAQVAADTPGIVTGRILTADGLPAAGVRVSVAPAPVSSTQNATTPLLNLVETDPTGNFRIAGVNPGRYHVVAGVSEGATTELIVALGISGTWHRVAGRVIGINLIPDPL
jgi:hypothetical protein